MKQILKSIVSLVTVLSPSISFASGFDLDFGADIWFVDAKAYSDYKHEYEMRNEYNNEHALFGWVNLEHFVPLVPNLGVRFGSFDQVNNGVKADFNYGDLIGYYSILDVTPVKLGGGLGFRFEDFSYDRTHGDTTYNDILPYIYGFGKIDLVGTALEFNAEVAASEFSFLDHTEFLDAKLGIDYELGGSFITWKIGGGYRYMYLAQDTSDYDKLTTIIKGPYLGLAGTF